MRAWNIFFRDTFTFPVCRVPLFFRFIFYKYISFSLLQIHTHDERRTIYLLFQHFIVFHVSFLLCYTILLLAWYEQKYFTCLPYIFILVIHAWKEFHTIYSLLECFFYFCLFPYRRWKKNKTNDNKDMYFMTNPNLFIEIHTLDLHTIFTDFYFFSSFVYGMYNGLFFLQKKKNFFFSRTLNVNTSYINIYVYNISTIITFICMRVLKFYFEKIFFSIILLTFFGIISVWAQVSIQIGRCVYIYVSIFI